MCVYVCVGVIILGWRWGTSSWYCDIWDLNDYEGLVMSRSGASIHSRASNRTADAVGPRQEPVWWAGGSARKLLGKEILELATKLFKWTYVQLLQFKCIWLWSFRSQNLCHDFMIRLSNYQRFTEEKVIVSEYTWYILLWSLKFPMDRIGHWQCFRKMAPGITFLNCICVGSSHIAVSIHTVRNNSFIL